MILKDYKIMTALAPLTWQYLGDLKQATMCGFGGVYIIVHQGSENRILYVGTSNYIGRRMSQHYQGYLNGHRTIWRVTHQQDAYSLMTAKEITDYVKNFKTMAKERKIWASTTINKIMPSNLLDQDAHFDSDWQQFSSNEYIPYISIWALNVNPYSAKNAVLIESAIQQRIVKTFELGRFFNHKDLSVLGKIEFNRSLIRIRQGFTNLPDVDSASKIALQAIGEKTIPKSALELAEEQLLDIIRQRLQIKAARKAKRDKKLAIHPKLGTVWTLEDLEKMRVMLVDYNMSAKDMVPHLQRPSSNLQKKIDKNDKISNRLWRIALKHL